MKIKSLSGRNHVLTFSSGLRSEAACKSKFQYACGQLLKKKYPFDNIYEEVSIPEDRLVIDFFIPSRKIAVECQGAQHSKHVRFFHNTLEAFHRAQARDNDKKLWCDLNNIILLQVDSVKELEEALGLEEK